MLARRLLTIAVLGQAFAAPLALADDVKYFDKDGIRYKETTRVVQRPVVETRYEPRQQTVYREQYRTEIQQSQQVVQVPVTEYQWVTIMRGRWNPFIRPYFANELVPTRRWETRQEVVQRPITRRELVPEQRTVQVAVPTQRLAEERVVTTVAVSPSPGMGGVAQLQNDPPRQGVRGLSQGSAVKR